MPKEIAVLHRLVTLNDINRALKVNDWRVGRVFVTTPDFGTIVVDARPRWWLPFFFARKVENRARCVILEHLRAGTCSVGLAFTTPRYRSATIPNLFNGGQ